MWSPYGKCQKIVRREWRENCIWEGANVVNMFKETTKKSVAKLLLWSSEEFEEREKKLKKVAEKAESKTMITIWMGTKSRSWTNILIMY